MSSLPTLPQAGAAVSADDVQRWENQVARAVKSQEDVARLDDWRKQAAALETYMRGKEMQRPMLGAQRRIEGRIGQLLGPADDEKGGRGKTSDHGQRFDDHQKFNFRLLARALADECELTANRFNCPGPRTVARYTRRM